MKIFLKSFADVPNETFLYMHIVIFGWIPVLLCSPALPQLCGVKQLRLHPNRLSSCISNAAARVLAPSAARWPLVARPVRANVKLRIGGVFVARLSFVNVTKNIVTILLSW